MIGMCRAWFYSPELSRDRILLPAGEAHHAIRSRRLANGARVAAFDGHGRVVRGRLRMESRGPRRSAQTWIEVERLETQPQPHATLTLVVAVPRPSRLDWMVEKCTELGVHALVLCGFARSTPRPAAAKLDRLRRIAIEACKQARRARLPELHHAPDPLAALRGLDAGRRLVAHRSTEARPLREALADHNAAKPLAVVIGPEGGLTDDELSALKQSGARAVHLGPYVLRVETAAIAVAAQWQAGNDP